MSFAGDFGSADCGAVPCLALFLYFRTAFKAGGWRNVRNSARIALIALVLFFIERIVQNREIVSLKNFVNSLFK